MAEPAIGEERGPSSGGGFFGRIRAAFHRVTPGEWILILIGIVGIVAYAIWYHNQQNSSSSGTPDALTPGGGTSNPDWSGAQASPSDPLESELIDLLQSLQNGGATVPGTNPTTNPGGATPPGPQPPEQIIPGGQSNPGTVPGPLPPVQEQQGGPSANPPGTPPPPAPPTPAPHSAPGVVVAGELGPAYDPNGPHKLQGRFQPPERK